MKFSDYLFDITERIKGTCNRLEFGEDDIRRDFHGMIYDIVYNYYCGYIAFELSKKIAEQQVIFTEGMYQNKTHIDRLREISILPMLSTSYVSSLNKNLIIGSWTSFELSVTTIADIILNEEEKNSLLNLKKEEVFKILNGQTIPDGVLQKLNKKLSENHLSHVPLWRKFKKIADKYKGNYRRDLIQDIAFVNFYGKMRNTLVHSNCIYFGKDFEFKFNNCHFVFENSKIFTYTEDEALPPRLYIELVNNLTGIFNALTDLLSEITEIKYPDTKIYWDE